MAPTRELAQQVESVTREIIGKKNKNIKIASFVGGNAKSLQLRALERGVHLGKLDYRL